MKRIVSAVLALALLTATAACQPVKPNPAPTVEPHNQ